MSGRHSRLQQHNQKQSNRQALLYLILSVLFIVGMIKWGLPGAIGLVSWWSQGNEVAADERQLKPQKPVLAPVPEATFSSSLKISGAAQDGVEVKLRLNGLDKDQTAANSDGDFSFNSVKLFAGENRIEVVAIKDEVESEAQAVIVIQDSDKPALTIHSPEEEHEFFGMDQKSFELVGEVSEEANVTVNDNFVNLDSENKFRYRTSLSEGTNDFTIKVEDLAGNATERLFRVFYTK